MELVESLTIEFVVTRTVNDILSFAKAVSQLGSLIYDATVLSSAVFGAGVGYGVECNRGWRATPVVLPHFAV